MTTRLTPKQSSPHRRWESLHVRKITFCAIFSLQASPGQSVKAAIPKQTASLDFICEKITSQQRWQWGPPEPQMIKVKPRPSHKQSSPHRHKGVTVVVMYCGGDILLWWCIVVGNVMTSRSHWPQSIAGANRDEVHKAWVWEPCVVVETRTCLTEPVANPDSGSKQPSMCTFRTICTRIEHHEWPSRMSNAGCFAKSWMHVSFVWKMMRGGGGTGFTKKSILQPFARAFWRDILRPFETFRSFPLPVMFWSGAFVAYLSFFLRPNVLWCYFKLSCFPWAFNHAPRFLWHSTLIQIAVVCYFDVVSQPLWRTWRHEKLFGVSAL